MEESVHVKPLSVRVFNRVLHQMARMLPGSLSLRPFLHRLRGVRLGANVFIGDDVYLENEYPECIEIEDNVEIGLRSVIVAHLRGPGKIIIKKNAWIGACCIISSAKGRTLTIGEGAVIGAGSIVTSDVSAHAFIRPEPPQLVAIAPVPLTAAPSYVEFVRSLRPIRPSPAPNDRKATGTTANGNQDG
jgi:hypothetical protein